MYSRASHPLEYIFTRAKNVLKGVPPPWVHFYKGKKCTGGRPTPLSTFLQGQKKCTQGRPTPLSTFLHSKTKKCNHTRGTSLSTFSLLALRQKNVLKGVGGPWVHFCIAKKKCTQGGGTPLSTFSLLIPRQENVLKGVGPPPVHLKKKMYRHKGDVFLLYLFGGGGGGCFWAKKNVLKGVGGPWLHFFLLFSPPTPPLWNPRGGGPKYIFNPPPPPRKNVHYILEVPP